MRPYHRVLVVLLATVVGSATTDATAQDLHAVAVPTLSDDTAAEDSPEGAFRQAPERINASSSVGVGQLVPDVEVEDLGGTTHHLAELTADGPLVIVMRDAGCPLCKRFGPSIAALESSFADRGVSFLYLGVQTTDTDEELAASQTTYGMTGSATRSDTLRAALQPSTTTEVFVLDEARTLRYRGAVDDQYGIGYAQDEAQHTYLADALGDVLAGRDVAVPATTAPGCVLESVDRPELTAPTWNGSISRIAQTRCQSCHRDGGVAPFALQTLDDARGHKGMIRFAIRNQIMPPWHAEGGGPWVNDRQLTETERTELLAWLDADCPEGAASDAPLPRIWGDDWAIGEPDLVVVNPKTYDVPAEGVVQYQYGYVQTKLEEDAWISAIEVRPGARQVVHHVLVFIEEPRQSDESSREFNRRDQGGLHGYFAAYVPGQVPVIYPAGHAKKLPAGSWLKFQVHYQPNGEAVHDETSIGLRFADGPPEVEVSTSAVSSTDLSIPAGDDNYRIRAGIRFDSPAVLSAFSPHMHLRGKAFRYELHYPDESRQVVLDVPRYDFSWQTLYQLAEPITVPAGTMLICTAWYDNSAENPANPDPEREIYFGEQTWEEMMIGYFEWWPTES
jgi:mono/diheme cytochrome c family protein